MSHNGAFEKAAEVVKRMIISVSHKYLQQYLQLSKYDVIEPYTLDDEELRNTVPLAVLEETKSQVAIQPYLLFKVGMKIFKVPLAQKMADQYC